MLWLKILSWEQINSSSFGLVWKCSTWKQLSHWLKCYWLLWLHWGRKKACSFWSLIRRSSASGISEGSGISLFSQSASSPKDASKWLCSLSHLLQLPQKGLCSRKGKDEAPFGGSTPYPFTVHSTYQNPILMSSLPTSSQATSLGVLYFCVRTEVRRKRHEGYMSIVQRQAHIGRSQF